MADVTKLPAEVFAVAVPNHELVHLAYNAYLANSRPNLARTLRRGEVSGGGKKPWKQKGTGRARFGSSRNPIWRKGGVVFGPLGGENYTKQLSTSAKRTAIRQALTLASQADKITIIEDFVVKEGKVKETTAMLSANKVSAEARVLLVLDTKTDLTLRATRNVETVKAVNATYLTVFDILNADRILITQKAIDAVTAWLGGAK